MRGSWVPRIRLLLLVLVALGLRLAYLGLQPLWWDEGWSLYFATSDVPSILRLTAVDIHPPLYYLLLRLWTEILGSSTLAVRLLSVFIGTLTVPLIYLTGRRLLGEGGGFIAALLLAISPLHIYYSQEVRMYGLATLLVLSAFYFALRLEMGRGSIGAWLGYVLSATAALYSEYYAAFALLAINLFVLARWVRGQRAMRDLTRWLAAQAIVMALYLPWLWYAGGKLLSYVQFKVGVEQDVRVGLEAYLGRHLAAFTWGHAEGLLADWWWIGLLPLLALVLALIVYVKAKGTRASWTWLAISGMWIVVLACGFAVNRLFPFNPPRVERLMLIALPFYLLAVAGTLWPLWCHRRLLAAIPLALYLVVALVSLGFFYTVPRYPDDDYRPLAARIRALGLPTDAIVNVHPWQVGYFHAYIPDGDARPSLILTPREVVPRERQIWMDESARLISDLDGLLAEHGRIWLPDHQSMGRVLESRVEAHLAEQAYPTLDEWHGENTVLSLFVGGDPAPQPVQAQFDEWLALERATLNRFPVESGYGTVTTDLDWRVLARPDERYHIGLRLADDAGRVWAQRDSSPGGGRVNFFDWPSDELRTDRHGLIIPAGTPPGEYRVTLRVYRARDIAVVPVVFEGGSGGEVTLGTVQVIRPATPPPLGAISIDDRRTVDFGWLQLLGHTVQSDTQLRPGEALEVDLFWRAEVDPGEDFLPQLQLLNADGAVAAKQVGKPVGGSYPTAWWQAGELVRDPHSLAIPALVPEGDYRLAVSLIRARDGEPLETRSGDPEVELGEITVRGREHRYSATQPAYEQEAPLDASVELIGYDLREVARAPGSPLEVTLHWHALEPLTEKYHAFVHLLDGDGSEAIILAQHDGPPGEGEMPSLGWLPGEYLTDRHLLQLPYDLSDGEYHLGVGLYDPETGQRLGERILLDTMVPVNASGGCNCR